MNQSELRQKTCLRFCTITGWCFSRALSNCSQSSFTGEPFLTKIRRRSGSLIPQVIYRNRLMLASDSSTPDCASARSQVTAKLTFVVVLSELVLITLTWRLWTGASSFPAVPLIPNLSWNSTLATVSASGYLFVLAALLFLSGLEWKFPRTHEVMFPLSHSRTGTLRQFVTWLSLLLGVLITLINQHLLQAWHWFFLLCLLQLAMFSKSYRATGMLRFTIAAVYLSSAVSRFTPEIEASMTGEIVAALLRIIGKPLAAQDPSLVRGLCIMLTAGEFLAGLVLIFSRSPRLILGCTTVLHLSLLAALGPWGLNHYPAVLCWNISFLLIISAIISSESTLRRCAAHPCDTAPESSSARKRTDSARLTGTRIQAKSAILMTVFLFGFPASGLFGIADNWLSWQLYSSRPEVFRLFVRADSISQLPLSLQPFVGPPEPLDDWCPVRIDRWSLSETGAPIYPEDRFQFAVIEAVAGELRVAEPENVSADDATSSNENDRLKIIVEFPERICWWRRTTETYSGALGLRELHRQLRQRTFLIR